MKKITVILLIFVCQLSFGQDQKLIDSLKHRLSENKDDIKTIKKLSILYQTVFADSAVYYAKRSIEFSKTKGKLNWLPELYTNLGVSHWYQGKLDSAQFSFEQSLKYNQPIKDSLLWAKNQCNLAILEDNQGKLDAAILRYEKGLKIFLRLKDSVNIYKTYSNLAILLYDLNMHQLALEKNKSALYIAKKIDHSNYIPILYNNVGLNYMSLNDIKNAIIFFLKGLSFSKQSKNESSEAILLGNLGLCYLQSKKYVKSKTTILEAMALNTKLNQNNYKTDNLINLAQISLKTNNFTEGINYLTRAKTYTKKSQNKHTKQRIFKTEIELLYKLKKFKKAFDTFKDWSLVNDSIINNTFITRTLNLETKYKTQQKENEILKLNTETQEKEITIQKSKAKTNLAMGGLFLFLIGGSFYLKKRKKDQKLKLLEESVKSSEQEKTRIGKELHDNIAGRLMKLVHDSETAQIQLSHKLLQTYNEVRDLSHQLNNTPMHGELFFERILDVLPENADNQNFHLQINPRHLEINEPYGTHIYRILQELVTNNLKYANASKTDININLENNIIRVSYADNGIGNLQFKKGKGYKNIEDRITLMNGTLHINTEKGFLVDVTIPYLV